MPQRIQSAPEPEETTEPGFDSPTGARRNYQTIEYSVRKNIPMLLDQSLLADTYGVWDANVLVGRAHPLPAPSRTVTVTRRRK